MASFHVRPMLDGDIPAALEVWREPALAECTKSLLTWHRFDPQAFQVAVTDSGEVIGTCGAVCHSNDLAYVGFYSVRKKYRGLGAGIAMWNACMDHVGSRNAALSASSTTLDIYRTRSGFPVLEDRFMSVTNESIGRRVDTVALSDTPPEGVQVSLFSDDLLQAICDYDLHLMGYDRSRALALNCREEDSLTLVALKNIHCVGFGTIKLSANNCGQVGPLYADSAEIAEVLLKRLVDSMPNATGFSMLTVSSNKSANELIKRLKCPTIGQYPRLYRHAKMDVDTEKIFAHFDLRYSPF